jgi:hypothetical protein
VPGFAVARALSLGSFDLNWSFPCVPAMGVSDQRLYSEGSIRQPSRHPIKRSA